MRDEKLALKDISDEFCEYKSRYVKPQTANTYYTIAKRHVLPEFGDKSGSDIREEDVERFVLRKMASGLAAHTCRDMLLVLKMLIKYGAKKGYWGYVDTAWKINWPTTGGMDRKIHVMDSSDTKRLWEFIEGNVTFMNLGIAIALFTGMRIGEVCGLQWHDIDTEHKVLSVRRSVSRIYTVGNGRKKTKVVADFPKTVSAIRDIPMAPQLYRLLNPLKKIMNPEFYVLSNSKNPTEPHAIRVAYDGILKSLGIEHVNFHCLRHTFATRCLESKADIKTISSILGHADIETTMNMYMHPDMGMKRSAVNKMSKIFK